MKLRSRYFAIFLLIGTIFFHNCSPNGIEFTQNSSTKLESHASGGGGEGFFGKPKTFVRTFPNYKCIGQPTGLQGTLSTESNMVRVTTDHCIPTTIEFNPSDSIVEYSQYNLDFLGVGTAIYELENISAPLSITEAWCTWRNDVSGLDVAIKLDNNLANSQAKIYLGSNEGTNGWSSRQVPLLGVSRNETPSVLEYSGDSFFLKILKPTRADQFGTGVLRVGLDGANHQFSLNCRVANSAGIEDMGTDLTRLTSLNSFAPDQQESVCNFSSALFCENFENRSIGDVQSSGSLSSSKFKNSGWITVVQNTLTANGVAFDGQTALEISLPSGSSTGGGIVNAPLKVSGLINQYYTRFYIRWSPNYKWSSSYDLYVTDYSTATVKLLGKSHTLQLQTTMQPASSQIFDLGVGVPSLNQWHCVEFGAKPSTSPTSSDGFFEMWLDNVKIISQQAVSQTSNRSDGGIGDLGFNFIWSCMGPTDSSGNCVDNTNPENQHPAQSIWVDNIVMARQRIGCF